MLAHLYAGQDVTGWYMSEKLDGVRAIWEEKKLISRNNKPINAPDWFTDALPNDISLDGELTCGRGDFQRTVSIVRKKIPINSEWVNITYKVFDTKHCTIFKDRYNILNECISINPIAQVVRQIEVINKNHLLDYYNNISNLGGEGLIIKNPNSYYEFRRSKNMLKLKPSLSDEAKVLSYQDGEGKYLGMMGALVCLWNRKIIEIGAGFTYNDRVNPPSINSVVTFKYQCLTDSGMPRFPVFVAERNYE